MKRLLIVAAVVIVGLVLAVVFQSPVKQDPAPTVDQCYFDQSGPHNCNY